MRSTYPDYFEK